MKKTFMFLLIAVAGSHALFAAPVSVAKDIIRSGCSSAPSASASAAASGRRARSQGPTGSENTAPSARNTPRAGVRRRRRARAPAASAAVKENSRPSMTKPCATVEARNITKPSRTASRV